MDKKIKLVMGQLCSGKTTYGEELAKKGYRIVDIGEIVREITGQRERVHDQSLEMAISVKLVDAVRNETGSKIAIIGIRQRAIIDHLVGMFPWKPLEIVWLQAEDSLLKARYYQRNDSKDRGLTYEQARFKDQMLGVEHLEWYIKNVTVSLKGIKTTIINTDFEAWKEMAEDLTGLK